MTTDPREDDLAEYFDDPYDYAEALAEAQRRESDPRDCAPGDTPRPDPLADDVDMTARAAGCRSVRTEHPTHTIWVRKYLADDGSVSTHATNVQRLRSRAGRRDFAVTFGMILGSALTALEAYRH